MNRMKPIQTKNIPEVLREKNIRLVLDEFMKHDALIVSDLVNTLGISKTTIIKIITQMLESGVLLEMGKAEPSVDKGRRPTVYTLNKAYRYFVSVQIFPCEIYTVVTDLSNTILHTFSSPITLSIKYEELLGTLVSSVNDVLAQNGIDASLVGALVVASSGPTNYLDGIIIYAPRFPNLPRQMHFREDLARCLPKISCIIVENEMRLQALAEQNLGYASALNLVLEAGDKLVSSLVDEKNNHTRGRHSTAGEIGHMVLDPHSDVPCVCGSKGCFLALVSISRVEQLAARLMDDYPDSVLHGLIAPSTILDIFAGFHENDPLCEAVMDDVARWFGQGIASIILIQDPESIVIQGIYTKAGDRFLKMVQDYIVGEKYPLLRELNTTIAYSRLGKDAGVLGGSIFATNHFLTTFKC